MEKVLTGKKVAILATDGVEESELMSPWKALERAGAATDLISLNAVEIRGWNHKNWGDSFTINKVINAADESEYDALFLPGGVINADTLRMDERAVAFVRKFFVSRKPVAAICHAPWMLAEAGVVIGRKVTSWPSLHTDLRNAGALWSDQEVVVDRGLVTSRNPNDLPVFNKKMIEEFQEGIHTPRSQQI